MKNFVCEKCKKEFSLPEKVLEKYPNWKPKVCLKCKEKKEEVEISDGIFTDGSATPNPGPGGWGVVWVENNGVVKELHGEEKNTTNNRMELTAIINALKEIPKEEKITIFSDSELCVNTLTKWAPSWEKNNWKRKTGEIKNLDLVKEAYSLFKERPKIKLHWIRGHQGQKWNEHVDSIARKRK